MFSGLSKLLRLSKSLYPTGSAFDWSKVSDTHKLHKGLGVSEDLALDFHSGILDQIFPDNENFTEVEAAKWEKRLGIINGSGNTIEDRRSAIKRKLNHPGDVIARQSHDYLESQLQLAGFDVYVHRNDLDIGFTSGPVQFGGFQFGEQQFGEATFSSRVVNHIDKNLDSFFNTGSNNRFIFYIGGSSFPNPANVPSSREDEFRQLILRLKPANMAAYLFINYV